MRDKKWQKRIKYMRPEIKIFSVLADRSSDCKIQVENGTDNFWEVINMRKITLFFVLALIVVDIDTAHALSLKIQNNSSWDIYELYLSDVGEDEWGPDQLDNDTIPSGSDFTLTHIGRGRYDFRIVDEDGDACEVKDVDFDSSELFILTDQLLLGCQMATDEDDE